MSRQPCCKMSVLYLGIDAPQGVFHYPVIRTQKIESLELRGALAIQDRFTHLIFTSKNGVRYWHESGGAFSGIAIAIGHATAKELFQLGISSMIPSNATQEGVIALLETMSLENSLLFYPRSKLARPHLANYLQKRSISTCMFDLYDTVCQKLEPVPNLDLFDEIVFTSPSTVDGFLRIFGKLPRDKKLTAIGPVTYQAIFQADLV